MKVFIWERIDHASSSWHTEGGLVVVAETEQRARELASKKGAFPTEDEKPDLVILTDHDAEAVFVFPDAGCC